jgi:hypothetical protein
MIDLNPSNTFACTTTVSSHNLNLHPYHPRHGNQPSNSPCFASHLSEFLGASTITAPKNASITGSKRLTLALYHPPNRIPWGFGWESGIPSMTEK